ncbi:helix-turn-helix domain-containing protein [Burkholderia pseudomallei]|uniref:helix-turn-helix domain-containing protein n=1 Tax=Burkholderia pseudomallei TaxID=28450 RepID=UPI000531905C|nr:helix-turn-helix transcriptional regulator [Burkholderia pseudomallei]KGS37309.1 helix-turn-helix family protein [Burkholderia pseudomallei ABCPW 107]
MEDSSRKLFAQRLRHVREDVRKLTQAELGRLCNLPATSISHFEKEDGTRKPSFDNFRALAKALNVTTDYLLGRTEDMQGNSALDEKLYRDVKSLSEADRVIAENLIKQLADRNRS